MKRIKRFLIFLVCFYYLIRIATVELRVIFIEFRQKRLLRVHTRVVARRDRIEIKYNKWLEK